MNSDDGNSINGWNELFSQIRRRTLKAINTPTFIFSFVAVIIICGSAGIWLPYILGSSHIFFRPDVLLTYGVSILASVIAEIILNEDSKSVSMLFFSAVVVALILLVCGLILTKGNDTAKLSIWGTVIVLVIWFMVNADDTKYDDKPSPNSPLGGAVTDSRNLPGEGF